MACFKRQPRSVKPGFTLLELLVTIVVIVILIAVSGPMYARIRAKAHKAACIGNMRAMHAAFAAAIQDQGHWPQIPLEEEDGWDEQKFFKWWVVEMEKYGLSQNTWMCPADKIALEMEAQTRGKDYYVGSYVPCVFDDNPNSPLRYNTPWVVERGTNHGKSSHKLMPDGSVAETTNPFAGR